MKFSFNSLDDLRRLYRNQLEELHASETQIAGALPLMVDAATDRTLKQVLENHLQDTKEHVWRLQQILSKGITPVDPTKCKALSAILSEGQSVIRLSTDQALRDACVIGAARKVEHYEIAFYGTVCLYAQLLAEHSHAHLLRQTLAEEKQTEAILAGLAGSYNGLTADGITGKVA
jgi:ferritin-like metal-binding protein YciE